MKKEVSNEERMNVFSKGNEKQEDVNIKSTEIDFIYTPLEEAKEEIWRRWNDKALKKKVEKFLGGDIPEVLKKFPRVLLARHILSPNFELLHFLKITKTMELRPLCLEYLHDKFVAENIDKYYLCKLFFHNGIRKKGESQVTTLKILDDMVRAQGKKFCDLKTVSGNSVVGFHHDLFSAVGMNSSIDRLDISSYYKRNGGIARRYYIYFFSLYVCHGVLFENYLLNKGQFSFIRDTVIPSYLAVSKMFGVKPLVVSLVPRSEEECHYWRFYPKTMRYVSESLLS